MSSFQKKKNVTNLIHPLASLKLYDVFFSVVNNAKLVPA